MVPMSPLPEAMDLIALLVEDRNEEAARLLERLLTQQHDLFVGTLLSMCMSAFKTAMEAKEMTAEALAETVKETWRDR